MKPPSRSPHVLIVGAGFGGINAARILARHSSVNSSVNSSVDSSLKITLIDRRNHHLFQPLLYQVATAGLSPADIAAPIRHLFQSQQNVNVLMDELKSVDPVQKRADFAEQTIQFDYLILACGSHHHYFGNDQWEEFAPGLKTIEQATEIRRRILSAFEEAEKAATNDLKEEWLNFVIVGGGPTGVELAGAIAELSQHTIRNDYRNIDPSKAKIRVIEAGARILAAFDPELSARAEQDLKDLGIEVKTNTRVTDLNALGAKIVSSNGEEWISARTVIWAAGVTPSITGKGISGAELDATGRVVVSENLNLEKFPYIFVIGDQAHSKDKNGKPLPGLAPVAIQQGKHAAKNILKLIEQKIVLPFQYLDKGFMATIGRKQAVVQTGKLKFAGLIAWLAWLFIHIYYLIGFKNRVFVMLQWFWSYVTYSRSARLIVSKDWRIFNREKG